MAATMIVKTPGVCGGRPRLDGHRLTVDHFVGLRNAGRTDAEILAEWDYLTQAQLDAVWTYYAAHKEEIDDFFREAHRSRELLEAARAADHVTVGLLMETLAEVDPDVPVGVLVDHDREAIRLQRWNNGKGTERVATARSETIDRKTGTTGNRRLFLLGTPVGAQHAVRVPEISPANARDWLIETLRAISEHRYNADWYPDLEFDVWNQVTETEDARKVAPARIGEDEKARIRFLSEIAGGFILNAAGRTAFVPLPEWQALYEAWLKSRR